LIGEERKRHVERDYSLVVLRAFAGCMKVRVSKRKSSRVDYSLFQMSSGISSYTFWLTPSVDAPFLPDMSSVIRSFLNIQ